MVIIVFEIFVFGIEFWNPFVGWYPEIILFILKNSGDDITDQTVFYGKTDEFTGVAIKQIQSTPKSSNPKITGFAFKYW